MRVLHVTLGTGVLLSFAACRPAPKATADTKAAPRVAMDSAEIERLCVQPDSVRKGLLDCVLKDQSLRWDDRLKLSPPPR